MKEILHDLIICMLICGPRKILDTEFGLISSQIVEFSVRYSNLSISSSNPNPRYHREREFINYILLDENKLLKKYLENLKIFDSNENKFSPYHLETLYLRGATFLKFGCSLCEVLKKLLFQLKNNLIDANLILTLPSSLKLIHLVVLLGLSFILEKIVTHKTIFNLDAQNATGRTVLHLAAQMGDWLTLKILCQAGVNVSLKDDLGHTAFDIVIQSHSPNKAECAEVLLRHAKLPPILLSKYISTLMKTEYNMLFYVLLRYYLQNVETVHLSERIIQPPSISELPPSLAASFSSFLKPGNTVSTSCTPIFNSPTTSRHGSLLSFSSVPPQQTNSQNSQQQSARLRAQLPQQFLFRPGQQPQAQLFQPITSARTTLRIPITNFKNNPPKQTSTPSPNLP